MAVAYLHTVGVFFQPWFDESIGVHVNLAELTAGQPLLPELPYESVDEGAPEHVKRYFGAYYQVPFMNASGTPVIVIAVSVRNRDVDIVDGRLIMPPVRGGNFFPTAFPPRVHPVLTRERAALVAFGETGRRVTTAPRPVLPGKPYSPANVFWEVRLEESVPIDAGGKLKSTNVLYVAGNGTLMHARRFGGEISVPFKESILEGTGRRSVTRSVTVTGKKGFATQYVRAATRRTRQ